MGLVRGMARTAVVAGTATAVSNRVSRRQASRWSAQEQPQQGYEQPTYAEPAPAPPPPAAPAESDLTSQLKDLADLHRQGILSDEEFAAAKSRLISG
jgi:Short C-terminal domain